MTPSVKDIANLPADKLPPLVHVPPVTRPFDVTIRPPGSKSLTNRALLLAALAEGESVLTGALADADDAQVMVRALRQLGAEIEVTPEIEPNGESCGNATIRVRGVGGRWKIPPGQTVTLNLNNAGTATRFLTATAVLQPVGSGGIVIDGNARMRERPIGELVDALRQLGVQVKYLGQQGFPPLRIRPYINHESVAPKLMFGQTLSSQFISAVMMTGVFLPWGVRIGYSSPPTSKAYIEMTGRLLAAFGQYKQYLPEPEYIEYIHGGGLQAFDLAVEADASSATYPLAAAAVCPGSTVLVKGMGDGQGGSLQADDRFSFLLRAFGSDVWRTAYERRVSSRETAGQIVQDMAEMPDAAMTAAAVIALGNKEGELRGLRTLRVKETDRVEATKTELERIGVRVTPFDYVSQSGVKDEGVRIVPPPGGIDCSPTASRVEFDTYDDHRMAMSLALIGLRRPNVYIRDPGCVRKTYPTFWRDLAKLYG